MLRSRNHSFLKPGILLVMPLALTGCLTDLGDQGSNGLSLSQAMQSSASGSREPLHGSGSSETHTSVDVDVNAGASTSGGSGGSGGEISLVSYEKQDYTWQILADVAASVPFNNEFQSITRYTLTPISMENDYLYVGLFLSGDRVVLQPGSLPAKAVDNIGMVEAGVACRFYLTPGHTFISPYISGNLAYQALFWNYRNPVFVNGDEIQSDSLEGIGGYAGFGVAINRNSHLSFFGEAGFGGTAFMPQTTQGFDNDVFHNFGYFSVKAGLCIKF